MEFQEYPKALYIGDLLCVVMDAAGEQRARGEGFRDWHEAQTPAIDAPTEAADEVSAPGKRKPARKAA
ncbi:hypothetical protein OU994_18055 [Pseudoduganella sp. SL102]|uniref:hypothetical protein n=1 Tax=Pseudoduganella sp. SL102 TaxID=2995154 RepID=UPI00248B7466|nr:hypothetical protein [Pseudoduganella sp. SL102]WBS00225.1 hypothetical protein OU994_18055 [Pseudoduganella sp. SL102]